MAENSFNPLSYVGVSSPNPPMLVIRDDADPTPEDVLDFSIGDLWVNLNRANPQLPQRVYMLTSKQGYVATWTLIGQTNNVMTVQSGTNITVNTVADVATVNLNPSVVLAGSLNAGTTVTAGTGITATTGNIQALSGNFEATNRLVATTPATLSFGKNRAGGAIVSGDGLGSVGFTGFDGVANHPSAAILASSTGVIAPGQVPSKLSFLTAPAAGGVFQERVVIDEDGTVIINATDGGENAIVADNLIETSNSGFSALDGSYTGTNTSASPIPSGILFEKSRAGGVIVSGDGLGSIAFTGNDGAVDQLSALISVDSTGAIAAGRVPSRITFSTTPDAVSAALPRVIITQQGTVLINATTGAVNSIVADNGISTTTFIEATDSVNGGALNVNNDLGAPAPGTTSFSNGNVANVPGGGTLSIDSQSANPGTQAGFIKIYVGATTAYIPYFTNIAP